MDRLQGTEVPVEITVTGLESGTFSDITSEAKFYGEGDPYMSVTIKSSDMKKVDDDTLRTIVPTKTLSTGRLFMDLTLNVPDTQAAGGTRIEKIRGETNVTII